MGDRRRARKPNRRRAGRRTGPEKGITTIFFETLVSPEIAETVAKEIGAKAQVLDPIEGVEARPYLTVMRSNLNQLRTALGCP